MILNYKKELSICMMHLGSITEAYFMACVTLYANALMSTWVCVLMHML